VRPWLIYSLVRLALLAAVFALLYWLLPPGLWWLSALAATIIALALSYLFLGRLRGRVSADLAARTQRRRESHPLDPDATAEDTEAEDTAPSEPGPSPGAADQN
jgi:membrane protein implicated in regulation of membrane protease activity